MPTIYIPGYTDTYKNIPWYYNTIIVCPRCAEQFTLTESDFILVSVTAGDVPSDTVHNLCWRKYDWGGAVSNTIYDPLHIQGICYNCGYYPIIAVSPNSVQSPGTDTNYPLFPFISPSTYTIPKTQFISREIESGIEIMLALYMNSDNSLYPTNDMEGRVYAMAQRYSGTQILPQLYNAGIGFNVATSYRELTIEQARKVDSFFVQFMELHGIILVE